MRIFIFSIILTFLSTLTFTSAYAQISLSDFPYEADIENPYGNYNPDAPPELKDFEDLIGRSPCKSVQRNQDGFWQDTLDVIWEFKYIMDGKGVQDITWKEDGGHSMSIRLFNPDSSKWVVTYFSSAFANFSPATWTGGKTSDGNIVLEMPQKAPGRDMEGTNRLTFYNISEESFDWIGEWISIDETIVYPFWKINCAK